MSAGRSAVVRSTTPSGTRTPVRTGEEDEEKLTSRTKLPRGIGILYTIHEGNADLRFLSLCGRRLLRSSAEVAGHAEREDFGANRNVDDHLVPAVHPLVHRQLEGQRGPRAGGEVVRAEDEGAGTAAGEDLGVRFPEPERLLAHVDERPARE